MSDKPIPNFPPTLAKRVATDVVQCTNCGCIFPSAIAVSERGRWTPCPHCCRVGPDAYARLDTVVGDKGLQCGVALP